MVTLRVEIKEGDCGDLSLVVYPEHKEPTDNELMESLIMKKQIENEFELTNVPVEERFKKFILHKLQYGDCQNLLNDLVKEVLQQLRKETN